jgi:hypothetical protein
VVLAVGAYLGSAVREWWQRPPEAGREAAGEPSPAVERVRVEVLNGGGRSGMAREATDRLRDRGFDVVYWGNAGDFGEDSSLVLDRVGRAELARSVAEALGIGTVRSEPDPNLLLDVSVVLGEDWQPGGVEPQAAAPRWWDVRRLFRERRSGVPGPEAPGERMADPGSGG